VVVHAVALVGSYLSDRFQCVFVGGIFSELIAVTRDVVQGSVLGTLLFSIFINDIVAQIDFCRFHMYADDVKLYLSDDPCSLDEYIGRMNADLDRLYIWATENGMCLNPEKSQAIVIGFPGVKNLGLTINSRFA
jgi:ribonucleases P/MRP protein subunit RPP40